MEFIPPPYGSATIPPGMGVITPRSNPVPPNESVVDSGRPTDAPSVASPTIQSPSSPEPGPEISSTRGRFRNLVHGAVRVNRLIELGDEVKAKVSMSPNDCKVPNPKPVEAVIKPRTSRVAGLVPKLQNMAPTQDIAAHRALVRHMQVSV